MSAVRLALAGIACLIGGSQTGQPAPLPLREYTIFFDPTVLEAADTAGIARLANELRGFVQSLPQRSSVAIYLVQEHMVQVRPLLRASFPIQTKISADEDHRRLVSRFSDTAAVAFRSEWAKAHSGGRIKQATSCILSTLYVAERRAKTLDPMSVHVVYLISDLVESCDDWGPKIRFERGLSDTLRIDRMELKRLRVGKLDSLRVYTVENASYMTPRSRQRLEDWWETVFADVGISPSRVQFVGELAPVGVPAPGQKGSN